MPKKRDGTNMISLLLSPQKKKRLQDIVEHIPYDKMTAFARRAIEREMELYEQDPEAYRQKYGVSTRL